MKTRSWGLMCTLVLGLAPACNGDDGDGADDANMEGDDGGEACEPMPGASFAAADESSCAAASTDFVPGNDSDPYPACMVDDGTYHLVADTPSSIARVEAFETMMDLLADPTPNAFVMARTEYAMDEGLESRVLRREDLHYPAIPMSDFDPDFEDDKQCSSLSNVEKHPNRCAGPARISPVIDAAFVAGIDEDGAPEVAVAQIDAAVMWFLFLSTYKEANTCITKAKDCDSSWAYYTGGFDRAGGIGLSEEVRALSDMAHERIFDGFSAVRCWREAYPIEEYPTRDDLPEEGERLLSDALEQLDNALWYGYARVVRDRIEQHDAVCGVEAEASLAWLQIAGPVLDFEAGERGAAEASTLAAFWTNEAPTAADLEGAVAAIDAIFPCPQG